MASCGWWTVTIGFAGLHRSSMPGASAWGYVIAGPAHSPSETGGAVDFCSKPGMACTSTTAGARGHELPRSCRHQSDGSRRRSLSQLGVEAQARRDAIKPQPQIPYHEFRWGAWLRQASPASVQLEGVLNQPWRRQHASWCAPLRPQSDLAGWRGDKNAPAANQRLLAGIDLEQIPHFLDLACELRVGGELLSPPAPSAYITVV